MQFKGNKMGKHFYLLLLVMLCIISPIHAQDKTGFGTGLVLLKPAEEGMFFAGQVQSQKGFSAVS
jgi:hypothetical protein